MKGRKPRSEIYFFLLPPIPILAIRNVGFDIFNPCHGAGFGGTGLFKASAPSAVILTCSMREGVNWNSIHPFARISDRVFLPNCPGQTLAAFSQCVLRCIRTFLSRLFGASIRIPSGFSPSRLPQPHAHPAAVQLGLSTFFGFAAGSHMPCSAQILTPSNARANALSLRPTAGSETMMASSRYTVMVHLSSVSSVAPGSRRASAR